MAEDGEDASYESSDNDTVQSSAYLVFFSSLLALVLVLSKLLHQRPRLASVLPEAGMIILVGMVAGSVGTLFETKHRGPAQEEDDDNNSGSAAVAESLLMSFDPHVFWLTLLPPIIFNSGYHLRREMFFRHLVPIALFAAVGTAVSALSIAFFLDLVVNRARLASTDDGPEFAPTMTELLAFGALISATDPVSTLAVFQAKRVDPHLFYLVFGESVLNDAVGLVLFNAFAKFVVVPDENGAGKIVWSFTEFVVSFGVDAVCSPVLGVLCGVGTALLFKYVDFQKKGSSKLLELSLYVLIMYVPFLLAESIRLSGIVTILFTGMTARSFVVPNLSPSSSLVAEQLFRLAAHLAETAIFLELGLSVFGLTRESFNGPFVGWAILACLVARALNVYPITFLFNRGLQQRQRHQHGQQHEIYSDEHHQNYSKNDDKAAGGDLNRASSASSNRTGKKSSKKSTSPKMVEMTDALASSDHHQAEEMYVRMSRAAAPGDRDYVDDGNNKEQTLQLSSPYPLQRQDTDNASVSTLTPRKQRDLKILPKTANMLWYSGLRGAVAYACSRSFPDTFGNRNLFIVTTMAIVLVTVFFLGGTTEIVLKLLNIDMSVDEGKYMEEWHQQRQQDGLILRFDDFVNRFAVRQQQQRLRSYEGDIETTDSCDGRASKQKQRQRQREEQISTSEHEYYHHHPIEVSASQHFADAEAMGYARPYRKKESLFDFGGTTDYDD